MSEALLALPAPNRLPDPPPDLLTARSAELALALATVVERLGSSDPAAGETTTFLRGWAEQAGGQIGGQIGAEDLRARATRPSPPLESLAAVLGLSDAEVRLLLLAGLAEEHEGLSGTFRALHPLAEPYPSAGLAALVLAEFGTDRSDLRRLLGEGSLVRHGALRLSGAGQGFERSLSVAEGLWDVLHGVDRLPADLLRRPLGTVPVGLDGWLAEPMPARAARLLRDRAPVTVVVTAAEEAIGVGRCAALLARAGATALAVHSQPDVGPVARSAVVHAAARDAVPVLVLHPQTGQDRPIRLDPLADVPGPVLVCAPAGPTVQPSHRPCLALTAGPVEPDQRRLAWRATPPGVDEATAARLAEWLPLDPAWVAAVCGDLHAAGRPRTPDDAAAALRRRIGTLLAPGVELVTPRAGWEGLVLPEEAGSRLRDAADRLAYQGTVLDDWQMAHRARAHRGVRVLLTGMPGTGKSLAAEVLAAAAGTDLLRVDLSQIVSKWLGETERNLAATFDAAERTRSVLLLDEADALFGTRTEISDAHDRYANLETAYLLQRLEAFDGLIVLTTNLRHNIDAAFLRRLDVVVDVPMPDQPARQRLWRLHLPTGHVGADVDVGVLARMYPIPGGWIRNAAVAAAFATAAAGESLIARRRLITALRHEYAKAALPFPGEPPRRRDEN